MRDHYFNARWFDWAPKHEPVHGGELAHQHRNSGGTKNSRRHAASEAMTGPFGEDKLPLRNSIPMANVPEHQERKVRSAELFLGRTASSSPTASGRCAVEGVVHVT